MVKTVHLEKQTERDYKWQQKPLDKSPSIVDTMDSEAFIQSWILRPGIEALGFLVHEEYPVTKGWGRPETVDIAVFKSIVSTPSLLIEVKAAKNKHISSAEEQIKRYSELTGIRCDLVRGAAAAIDYLSTTFLEAMKLPKRKSRLIVKEKYETLFGHFLDIIMKH